MCPSAIMNPLTLLKLLCTKLLKTTPACQVTYVLLQSCAAPVLLSLQLYAATPLSIILENSPLLLLSAAHVRVSVSISIFRMKSIGRYRYSFYLQKCIGDTDSIGIGICVGQYRYVICLSTTELRTANCELHKEQQKFGV